MIDILFGNALYSNKLNIDTQEVKKNMSKARKANNNKWKDTDYESSSLYVLEESQNQNLKKIIDFEIYNYANNIMKYDAQFKITTSWFTEVDLKEHGEMHYHTNSFLSGVLYLNVNKKSGNITFHKLKSEIDVPTLESNQLNSDSYTIEPENGLFLLFPSKLFHSIGCNESEEIRNSLAFNVMPVGRVGLATADSHMKIKLL